MSCLCSRLRIEYANLNGTSIPSSVSALVALQYVWTARLMQLVSIAAVLVVDVSLALPLQGSTIMELQSSGHVSHVDYCAHCVAVSESTELLYIGWRH